MEQKIIIAAVILLVVAAVGIYMVAPESAKRTGSEKIPPGTYTELAQCIAASGTKFYGAFWCPHCNEQKAAFGDAAKLLPYIECSLPDRTGITQECKDAGVEGFPTWVFPNGSRKVGEVSPAELATITGCALPNGAATTTNATGSSSPVIEITPIGNPNIEIKPEVQ